MGIRDESHRKTTVGSRKYNGIDYSFTIITTILLQNYPALA